MKKIKFMLLTTVAICGLTFLNVNAASGTVTVYYHSQLGGSRKPTYTHTKTHMESIGYTVEGFNNADNSNIYNKLSNSKILVMHTHGDNGAQQMNTTYLIGRELRTNPLAGFKAVADMPGNANQMKIAIYYGCKTGLVSNVNGDLPLETVNKGAQAAIAWKVDTVPTEVNEWNRLFFEKAKNSSIVESMRHADYWLRDIKGNTAGDRMQLNRNEKGNVNGYVY